MMDHVHVKGARIHNLKNLDIKIPKHKIIAITGVSGSGKSSLAFDIIYNEGMRRYLQSIGFPPKLEEEKPFDLIEGLSPCIAVEQRTTRVTNPRSTVGTRTTLYTMLRMLYSIESRPSCPVCLVPVEADFTCDICGMKAEKLQIKHFSFNEPSGMCLECNGRGYIMDYTLDRVIPDEKMSIREILKSATGAFGDMMKFTISLAEIMDFSMDEPWCNLEDDIKDVFLYGTKEKVKIKWKSKRFEGTIDTKYEGVIPHLKRAMATTTSQYRRSKIEKNYMVKKKCPDCLGYRINAAARGCLINGKHIGDLATMPVRELNIFLSHVTSLSTTQGKALRDEISRRLKNFSLVGISYLHLNRILPSLSGGELQRLSLLSHLDASLDSVIFLLDEPTMGMHQLEKRNLKTILQNLRDIGNSIIIIEHDIGTISIADQIIDIGPGAGTQGGYLVFQGTMDEIKTFKPGKSLTADHITGAKGIPIRDKDQKRIITEKTSRLVLMDVETNNLKKIHVEIPLGVMTGVCGVSGSGKSSLIIETLKPLLEKYFKNENGNDDDEEEYLEFDEIKGKLAGWEDITKIVVISQAPIGRSRISTPASYTKMWDKIRKLYSRTDEARKRKYKPSHFSFNSAKGQCPHCKGSGSKDLQVSFLSNVDIPCEECNATGYLPEILEIEYKGKNINEVLNMTVNDAIALF